MSLRSITLRQLADETDMSVAFWRKQIRLGKLQALKIGRSVRVRLEDAHEFLAECEQRKLSEG